MNHLPIICGRTLLVYFGKSNAVIVTVLSVGKAEIKVARSVRLSKLQRGIIALVGGAGILTVGLMAPNALWAFEKVGALKWLERYTKGTVKRSFSRLIENGLIHLESSPKGKVARLTPKGEAILKRAALEGTRPKKPAKWDRKWRLLIFDIREERRVVRNKLRATLTHLGFVRLQNSVWVYPYDCEDLIALVKADLRTGRDVLYVIADSIEDDTRIRKRFGLPE